MALIKYYNLESRSWEDVSNLERNLQKHLLDEKHVRGFLETDVEKIAEAKAGNGDKDTLAALVYDSGEFDVLYRESTTISKEKKRWFGKNIPPRIGTELVVRAIPEDMIELQDYLASSGFDVIEVRVVSNAILNFGTGRYKFFDSESYKDMIQRLIQEEYPMLKVINISPNSYINGYRMTFGSISGNVSGDLVQVLEFRNVLRKSIASYAVGVSDVIDSVTFFQ